MTERAKRYGSVSQLLHDLSEDQEFNREFDEHVGRREVVKVLFALRTAKSVSQKAIAENLDCSQSRVSKIENGVDSDLRLGELEAYARALDCEVQLVFKKRNSTAVDEVKHHAFAIKREMDQLAELAAADETIAKGVGRFFGEAFFNLVTMLQDSAQKLPNNPRNDKPYVHFSLQVDELTCEGEPVGSEQEPAKPKRRPAPRDAAALAPC